MRYTIENHRLRLVIDSLGAQLLHIQSREGLEYLWQGDSTYWSDRAPNLFPFVGRLTRDSYQYQGKTYPMGIHGFASAQEFSCRVHEKDYLLLELTDNEETRKQYPFAFSLWVGYRLEDSQVKITYEVKNPGK